MTGSRFLEALGGIRKAGYAIAGVLLCEIGARVAVPTPDPQALGNAIPRGGLLSLYNWLAGGAMARGSMLALGIMPYASARMFMALAGIVSSRVRGMSSHADGRKTLVHWTRALTTVLALIQSYGFARFTEQVPGVVAQPGLPYIAQTMLVLTTGALFMMWLCEQILAPSDEEELQDTGVGQSRLLNPPRFEPSPRRQTTGEEPLVVPRTH